MSLTLPQAEYDVLNAVKQYARIYAERGPASDYLYELACRERDALESQCKGLKHEIAQLQKELAVAWKLLDEK